MQTVFFANVCARSQFLFFLTLTGKRACEALKNPGFRLDTTLLVFEQSSKGGLNGE